MNNSEFLHFGILPSVSIHSPVEDQYSKMYIPRKSCDCGAEDWLEAEALLFQGLPPKKVHRCKVCDEIRLADHIGLKQAKE